MLSSAPITAPGAHRNWVSDAVTAVEVVVGEVEVGLEPRWNAAFARPRGGSIAELCERHSVPLGSW